MTITNYSGIRIRGRNLTGVLPHTVVMPCCGAFFSFNIANFPLKNMPCPCGRKHYYVVFFEENIS
jgi:hypothetical protein